MYFIYRWAKLTATIFVNAGYPVKLFSYVVPTPFIPFSVLKYKCASGIMITASHNPKEDNGYKVVKLISCKHHNSVYCYYFIIGIWPQRSTNRFSG